MNPMSSISVSEKREKDKLILEFVEVALDLLHQLEISEV